MGARADQISRKQLADSEQRQDKVVEMYLTGRTLRQIAAETGVSTRTVVRDIGRAREEWKERAARTYSELLPDKLAELERMRQAAWDGWSRSLRPAKRKTETTFTNAEGGGSSDSLTTERRDGDPRFLALLEKYLRLECQLLGMLDADPGDNQPPPVFVEVVVNNREEVEQYETLTIAQFKDAAQQQPAG